MNILLLSTWCPFPPDNGAKIRAYYLLRSLAQAHQVTLVAFCPPAHDPISVPANVTFQPVAANPFRYVDLPQIVKYLSPTPLAFWPVKEMATTVERLCRREDWDVIVALQAHVARYALRQATAPRILDVDTALSYQMRERYQGQEAGVGRGRAWVSWYKAHRYERDLFRRYQACTVVSAMEVANIQAMVKADTRVAVVPNGVDCAYNTPGLAATRPNTLVYNGALTYHANYDAMAYFLAEIYPLVKRDVPDIGLTITGSTQGVDTNGLQKDPSVRFTGYVQDIRIPVAESSVCVIPLREGGGTRLKILEAMALGTPVVATRKGAEGLKVIDGEHLLIADSPDAFAAQVARLLRDPALKQRLVANARRLVEREYDWAAIGRQFVDVVEDVVRTHRTQEA